MDHLNFCFLLRTEPSSQEGNDQPVSRPWNLLEARNNIETLVSMVEMACCLPYKHEESTVAINLVDAQLEQDLSQSPFARNQDRFEMMWILSEERVEQ